MMKTSIDEEAAKKALDEWNQWIMENQIADNIDKDAFKQGFIEGFIEGYKQGFAEGYEKSQMEIAQELLKINWSIEDISKVTGLSLEKVRDMSNY